MSRYIDADALNYYGNHLGDEYEDRFPYAQWVYRSDIDSAPSTDIVRCGECKYAEVEGRTTHYLVCQRHPYSARAVDLTDFCSEGKRKESE